MTYRKENGFVLIPEKDFNEFVLVPEKEFAEMERSLQFLSALEAAGVDNWEGYEIAQDMMED